MEAYAANAVHSEYILKWLENISTDLIKLESEAAPEGWQCLWDRYVNLNIVSSIYLSLFRFDQLAFYTYFQEHILSFAIV